MKIKFCINCRSEQVYRIHKGFFSKTIHNQEYQFEIKR